MSTLIAFEHGGETAVMHYLGADTSFEAVNAEVARVAGRAVPWKKISRHDYAAIRAARPKPVSADVHAAKADPENERLLQAVAQMLDEMGRRLGGRIDAIETILDKAQLVTDVRLDVA